MVIEVEGAADGELDMIGEWGHILSVARPLDGFSPDMAEAGSDSESGVEPPELRGDMAESVGFDW